MTSYVSRINLILKVCPHDVDEQKMEVIKNLFNPDQKDFLELDFESNDYLKINMIMNTKKSFEECENLVCSLELLQNSFMFELVDHEIK